ncbi:hypothetical protein NP233_g3866 [Leucocoprinus birnbaumii]|uniref:Uncharacterized protein n=1 Tax=Leucocoprinus birnbaumii TaxID=56174 RepID=A0AAD5VVS0_9AGAR|nr:hypothetical protein NP233_g3866 [Leucocoprinus birnbaumii]
MAYSEKTDAAYQRIHHLPTYTGRDDWIDRVGWKTEGHNAYLYKRRVPKGADFVDAHAAATIVGLVTKDHHRMGTTGSYSGKSKHGTLSSSRLNMTLACPEHDPRFKAGWKNALKHFERLLTAKSRGGEVNEQCSLVIGGDDPTMRFSAPLFEPKDPGNPEEGDDEIEGWPVPDDLVEELDAIKKTHRVLPLPVFDSDLQAIMPMDVSRLTLGALIELTFEVKYWKTYGKVHNFSARTRTVAKVPITLHLSLLLLFAGFKRVSGSPVSIKEGAAGPSNTGGASSKRNMLAAPDVIPLQTNGEIIEYQARGTNQMPNAQLTTSRETTHLDDEDVPPLIESQQGRDADATKSGSDARESDHEENRHASEKRDSADSVQPASEIQKDHGFVNGREILNAGAADDRQSLRSQVTGEHEDSGIYKTASNVNNQDPRIGEPKDSIVHGAAEVNNQDAQLGQPEGSGINAQDARINPPQGPNIYKDANGVNAQVTQIDSRFSASASSTSLQYGRVKPTATAPSTQMGQEDKNASIANMPVKTNGQSSASIVKPTNIQVVPVEEQTSHVARVVGAPGSTSGKRDMPAAEANDGPAKRLRRSVAQK